MLQVEMRGKTHSSNNLKFLTLSEFPVHLNVLVYQPPNFGKHMKDDI